MSAVAASYKENFVDFLSISQIKAQELLVLFTPTKLPAEISEKAARLLSFHKSYLKRATLKRPAPYMPDLKARNGAMRTLRRNIRDYFKLHPGHCDSYAEILADLDEAILASMVAAYPCNGRKRKNIVARYWRERAFMLVLKTPEAVAA
jgi:hypothetical protein